MKAIRIGEQTSISEVMRWEFEAETSIDITKSASFEIGAQGLALSCLRTALEGAVNLTVTCNFDEPTNSAELSASVFATAFGYSLVRLSNRIYFAKNRIASPMFKRLLAATYRDEKGCFGDGKQRSVVFAG